MNAPKTITLRGSLSDEDFSIAYLTKFNGRKIWTVHTYRTTKEDAVAVAKRLRLIYYDSAVIPPGMSIEEVLGATE